MVSFITNLPSFEWYHLYLLICLNATWVTMRILRKRWYSSIIKLKLSKDGIEWKINIHTSPPCWHVAHSTAFKKLEIKSVLIYRYVNHICFTSRNRQINDYVTKTFSHDNKKWLNSTNFLQHKYKWLNKWLIWLSDKN